MRKLSDFDGKTARVKRSLTYIMIVSKSAMQALVRPTQDTQANTLSHGDIMESPWSSWYLT